jgi:uncharacterized protein (TIGR03437 family)
LPGGVIAQGSIFSIFGTNPGPASSPVLALPLVTTLGGVSIKVSQGANSVNGILTGQVTSQPVNSVPNGTHTGLAFIQ